MGSDKRGSSGRAGIDNLLSHAADKSGREPGRQGPLTVRGRTPTWLPLRLSSSPPTDSPSGGTTSPTMSRQYSGSGKLCVCASVTLVYRQLRRDGQLADVTLMCAGGRQVRAGGIYGWSKHNGGKSNIVCEESSRKLSPVQSAADINMRDQ